MNHSILDEALEIKDTILSHRRWLHRHAETGFSLSGTTAYVRKALEDMGYTVENCGKSGLVTTIGGSGKVFLLRADMDALPIREEADLDFASKNGNMHACGHDCHTAMLLGAAQILKNHEQHLKGTVKLLFQPAEETLEGAADVIAAGVLEKPKVDAAMMVHMAVGIPIPAGTVLISAPSISAPSADYFTIRIQGKGCHGSAPQDGIDALTAAAHVLIALQAINARELGIYDEAVLTIGRFQGGRASNVIADSATLGGTLRCFDPQLREHLKLRIQQISTSIAAAFRAEARLTFDSGCPSLINDEALCAMAEDYLPALLGDKALSVSKMNSGSRPTPGGSEDFAYISQKVPAFMVALAAGEPQKGYPYPLHHPKVCFDETALPYGTAALAHTAMCYLQKL